MALIAWLGRLVGLSGAGLVGLGALLMLDQAYTIAMGFMMAGLLIILADMALLSFVRKQSGLGVIY